MRFSNNFSFQWVENLWKKESIEKHKCLSYFFVNTKVYIIEFNFAINKRSKRVETLALKTIQQIESNKSYEAYLTSGKKIILFILSNFQFFFCLRN